jgi:hypothetical protein
VPGVDRRGIVEWARRADEAGFSTLGYTDRVVDSAATDEDTVSAYLKAFEGAGADEVICFRTPADPEQVDLLAAAAL